MPRRKRVVPIAADLAAVEPFGSSEEAWFWFARCQMLRRAGARFERDAGRTRRPCDPDDIYRVAMSLHRAGRIDRRQLAVLARFGALERAPDERVADEQRDAPLWRLAMDRLTSPLAAKGIILSNKNQSHRETAVY